MGSGETDLFLSGSMRRAMEKLRTGAVGVSGDFALSGEDSRGPSGRAVDWNGCIVEGSCHI